LTRLTCAVGVHRSPRDGRSRSDSLLPREKSRTLSKESAHETTSNRSR
jgi:hypothetical protein